jgi:ABC-type amino acid transport substrate-binding protein
MSLSSALSKGCLYDVSYVFEKLINQDEDDTFVFSVLFGGLRYNVHIYGDYSYTVISPRPIRNAILLETVDAFVESFLAFCQNDVNKEYIYCSEDEIQHYLLAEFGVYIIDWCIWYAFFSRPYYTSTTHFTTKDLWYHKIKIAHCVKHGRKTN